MITPRFNIKQTESDLIFTIHAPYASIADAEIYADVTTFCFYAAPYYLRLHLSGQIEETDASKGSYDADTGTFVICVQKVTKGEHFKDLDFITSLLTPSHEKPDIAKPLVEVIDGEENETNDSCDEDEFDWYIDQCPFDEPSEEFLLSAPHYGFAHKISGAFLNFKTEFLEVIDLPDPDQTPVSTRAKLRSERETEDFSDDHYLADWAQSELIEPLLTYTAHWENCADVTFLEEEVDILKDLPKKEFLLDKKEEQLVSLSLVDIMFAYAYNIRTTMGDNTVESAWTVNKLSGTFSWLQNFSTLKEAVSVSFRRSLCYPLYRNWELATKVLSDVKKILKQGKRKILKCLLEMYVLFNNSEPRYLLNQLYIRDYCIWIQRVSESQMKSLAIALDKVSLKKSDMRLDLEELETAAEIVRTEEEAAMVKRKSKPSQRVTVEQVLCKDIDALSLSKKSKESSSNTSDSEEDSSDSSDSEEDSSSSSSSSNLDSDDLSETEST